MSANTKETLVLKIGGNEVEDEGFLRGLVETIQFLCADRAVVVVHGGGREIADLHARFEVPFETVEGLRATSPEGMRLVEMALNGSVNTRLVRWLVNGGIDAIGLSGIDMGLLRVERLAINGRSLGQVGQVQAVNDGALRRLLTLGLVPVISPVSLGVDGLAYNVNADHAAMAVARAVAADQLVFVTNVPGVQVTGHTVPFLVPHKAESLIADGAITGGMIPKVRSAMEAVASGVVQAVITNLAGLAQGTGTAVIPG